MKITARYGNSVGRFLVALIFLGACAPVATITTPTPTVGAAPTASPTTTRPPAPSPTPALMPLFDAHLHYSAQAWSVYPPEAVAKILDSVGVRSGLTSSAPDEGTFKLRAVLGDRIIPMLGPYRNVADVFS